MEETPIWKERPRSELFVDTLFAVTYAQKRAGERGNEQYIRFCEEELLPFVEAELERAVREEEEGSSL
jgi:hypothetical protein